GRVRGQPARARGHRGLSGGAGNQPGCGDRRASPPPARRPRGGRLGGGVGRGARGGGGVVNCKLHYRRLWVAGARASVTSACPGPSLPGQALVTLALAPATPGSGTSGTAEIGEESRGVVPTTRCPSVAAVR